MSTFVDPRIQPDPRAGKPTPRTTADQNELAEFHRLCREHRLYEVERWIQAGHPLQLAEEANAGRRRVTSALEIGLEDENQALVLLLLCNGYDANLERGSPLDLALRARRWDLLDLLLDWGADPRHTDLEELFGTYNSALWERFRKLGVDLTADRSLAHALAHHTSNKPLFGFAKRHREQNPKIQAALNMALGYHVEEESERGVQLCLWAGADPHAPAPSLRYADPDEEEDSEDDGDGGRYAGMSAIWRACLRGNADLLKRLGPDPERDDFEDLYRWARSGDVVELLASVAPPRNAGVLVAAYLDPLTRDYGRWRSLDTLKSLFKVGTRWVEGSADEIAGVRRLLLKISDDYTFVDVMKLLVLDDHCSPEVLKELARTPSMRSRMQKVGFIPLPADDPRRYSRYRPTRSREVLKKCGIELPKSASAPRLSRVEHIGAWRRNGREIRLDRKALFEQVWSTPVQRLAEEWGLSDRGLAKACLRLQVPVPPRGYWAKLEAGRRVRRPKLPALPAGEAEEIVIWVAN